MPVHEIKAAYLYNFAKFVEWPPGALPAGSDPFVICAYGDGPVADALKQGVEGKTVQGRKIAVKVVESHSDANACQVLYFDMNQSAQLAPLLPALQAAHVLTVGETGGFTKDGGIIGFTVEASQLRFIINNAEAKKSGLRISSKLLSLATAVNE